MYHVKNDKRCQKSARLISNALIELLNVKPLADITVSDLQRKSGTGRATFYRLFDNIDDVVAYISDLSIRDMVRFYRNISLTEMIEHFLNELANGGHEINNILASGKAYIVSDSMIKCLTEEAEKNRIKFDNRSKYTLAVFVGSCLSLIAAWDENGRQETIEELTHFMQRMFNYEEMAIELGYRSEEES